MKPGWVTPAPIDFDGHAITIDDGYSPNVDFTHEPCGLGNIWYGLSVNEDGWRCWTCLWQFGFEPRLDRVLLRTKVRNILFDMVMAHVVYVSNSSEGDSIVYGVMHKCVEADAYDQGFIIRCIVNILHEPSGSSYWQKQAAKVLEPENKAEKTP